MSTSPDQITHIILPAQLSEEQRRMLVAQSQAQGSLTQREWVAALAVFDLLHTGQVIWQGETLPFSTFYTRAIDAAHATGFLEQLLTTADAEAEGRRLMLLHWQQIRTALTALGVTGETVEGRVLLAYCLYWWQSFSKGYIREVAVFRALAQAGIAFEAHDLRDPVARRSAYDLVVLGRYGDVKTSTYFVHTARAFPLRCDFYLVRMWDNVARQWIDLVLLTPDAWHELDGEPVPCSWEMVAQLLPTVVQVIVRGEALVVVPYELWQTGVLRKQALQRKEENR